MRKMIYEPFGGLCNRLRNMDYVFGLYKQMNLDDFVLYWYNDRNCGCNLEDIIEPTVKFKNKPFPKNSISKCIHNRQYLNALVSARNNIIYRGIYKKYQNVFIEDADYQYRYDELPGAIESVIDQNGTVYFKGCHNGTDTRDYSWLKFKQEIITEAQERIRNYPDYISLHIRRTDHKLCILQSPTFVFFDFMDEVIRRRPDQLFYVASDDESIVNQAREQYGENIIPHQGNDFSRMSKEGIREAVIEFLILAHSKRIYGSISSSFSEEAGHYGNVPVDMLTVYDWKNLADSYLEHE